MNIVQPQPPKGWKMWALGLRPRTLTIGASPVVAGAGLAFFDQGNLDWLVLGITIFCALAIQAGTNLYNDAIDGEKGHDTAARLGPARITAQGWASGSQVKLAALVCFASAALGGAFLIYTGGWVILLIGLFSIISGYAYSAGPFPLSHTPLSEAFVVCFFGIIAVSGTYFLQVGHIGFDVILTGIAIGSFGAAVMMVNNSRDRAQDQQAGRRTLAIIAGTQNSKYIYALLVITPFLMQFYIAILVMDGPGNWLPLLPFPFALFLIWQFHKSNQGAHFNILLTQTAKLQFAFSVLLALGLTALKLEQSL